MNNYFYYPFRRSHPVKSGFGPRGGGFHYGLDFGWNVGDDEERRFLICASADGVVDRDEFEAGGGGDWLRIRHAGDERTVYMHMSSKLVHLGDTVVAGQGIGISGETGGVPTHLHFEIHDRANHPVDPEPLLQWPTTPVPVPPSQENPLPPYVYSVNDTWFWVWFDPARGQFVKRYVPPEEAEVANRCIFSGQAKGIFVTDNLNGIPDA